MAPLFLFVCFCQAFLFNMFKKVVLIVFLFPFCCPEGRQETVCHWPKQVDKTFLPLRPPPPPRQAVPVNQQEVMKSNESLSARVAVNQPTLKVTTKVWHT